MDTILTNTKYIPDNVVFKIDMKNHKNIIYISNRKLKKEHLLNINIIFLDNIDKYYRLKDYFSTFFINILKNKFNFLLYLKIINNIIIPNDQKTEVMIKYMLNINNSYLYSLYVCNFNKLICLFSNDKKILYNILNKFFNRQKIEKNKNIEILYIKIKC